jgi:hypothetical protein
VLDHEIPVGHAHIRFDGGLLIDDEIRARLAEAVDGLVAEARAREELEALV